MPDEPRTFGAYISEVRKEKGLSQKQLAELVEREEGGSISPQYLNDIEHDRRSPSSDHIIQQFARILKVSANYLYYLAGRMPAELRDANMRPHQVDDLVATAFRRTSPPKRKG
jgi:transcriptional regulator with XRE-family HTH domain